MAAIGMLFTYVQKFELVKIRQILRSNGGGPHVIIRVVDSKF
jgi:hypothetical protein